MAKGDISIVQGDGVTPRQDFDTDDRDTSSASRTIKAGEPVKLAGVGNNFAIILATVEPVVTGTDRFIGIAENESTDTATADGVVNVAMAVPFITKMRCKASTVANIDTAAKVLLLMGDSVIFELSATTPYPFTVDENKGDDPNENGLVMVDFDIEKGMIDFFVKPMVCLLGNIY